MGGILCVPVSAQRVRDIADVVDDCDQEDLLVLAKWLEAREAQK